MNGSVAMQTLYQQFVAAAQTALTGMVGPILIAEASVVAGCIGFNVVIYGTRMMAGSASVPDAVRKLSAAVIIAALMAQGTFNQYVATFLTTTVPGWIDQAAGGGTDPQTSARGYDGLNNYLTNQGAQIRAQLNGVSSIGDRVAVWLAEMSGKFFLFVTFLVYALAQLCIYAAIPQIAMLLWSFLFDTTRSLGLRAVMHTAGLLLIMAMTLSISNFTIRAESVFMQQVGHTVPLNSANQNFSLNSGDVTFTGFNLLNAGGDANSTGTIDAAGSIGMMMDAAGCLLFGLFLIAGVARIAMSIAATSGGWSSGTILSTTYQIVTAPVSGALKAWKGRK